MININLLPKHLRRVREPGYWKLVAVLFPLLVLGTIAFMQFARNQAIANLEDEVVTLEARRLSLQVFIERQNELNRQLAQLEELLAVRDQVRQNTITWTSEISAMLETLPAQGNAARPRIDFQSLTMNAVNDGGGEDRYEGQPIVAEMSVSGNVVSTEVLSEYIRALETSPEFGVAFQSATRDDETDLYTYSLNIGALAGGEQP